VKDNDFIGGGGSQVEIRIIVKRTQNQRGGFGRQWTGCRSARQATRVVIENRDGGTLWTHHSGDYRAQSFSTCEGAGGQCRNCAGQLKLFGRVEVSESITAQQIQIAPACRRQ
jgi:hypothetical protein